VLSLKAIKSNGTVDEKSWQVELPRALTHPEPDKKAVRRQVLVPSLGVSKIFYREGDYVDISEFALTLKASYRYVLLPRWSLDAGGYLTVLANGPARFFGANLRVAYLLPWVEKPWDVSIMVGPYYLSMPVRTFGFSHLMGPQIFVVLGKGLDDTRRTSTYFKFSPVGSGFSLQNLSDRELAAGLGYSFHWTAGHPGVIGFDVSNLFVHVGDIPITVRTFSLSAGYLF
jgi:hypothetical protein